MLSYWAILIHLILIGQSCQRIHFSLLNYGLIFQYNYVHLDHPTHVHGSVLDLIVTTMEDMISHISIYISSK